MGSEMCIRDRCLSVSLVAVAKERGVVADHVAYIGKGGSQDWNLVPFAAANDYIVVTNNRRDLLKEYLKLDIHGGLIIIVPAVRRNEQRRLFEKALEFIEEQNEDIINKVVEVLLDGTIAVREWTSETHDVQHIANPEWRS